MRVSPGQLRLAAFAASLVLVQSAALAASAEKGKSLFMSYGCFQCHGTLGQGGNAGPRLAPNPMPYEALATSCAPPIGRCRPIEAVPNEILPTSMPICIGPASRITRRFTAQGESAGGTGIDAGSTAAQALRCR